MGKGHRFYTQTDTEVLIHLYEEYGPDCLKLLNGQFALAIWDAKAQTLFLGRDRLGIRPLFYTCHNGRLIFGSEVKAILADALYGHGWFMNRAAEVFAGTQTISQLHKTQKVRFCNREMAVAQYFAIYPGIEIALRIRGFKEVKVVLGSARLHVKAHEQKRFVVALKYEGEEEYRYLVASDMSWRAVDIATAYTLRWLVEVFFEDWKLHEGWGRFAPQFDEEGSSRSLSLSLLLDYALLLHPEQLARVENNLPACTVGSLQQKSRMDALVEVIRGVVDAPNPHEKLDKIIEVAKTLFPLKDSAKHMNGRNLGRLEPTPSLKYRAEACMA